MKNITHYKNIRILAKQLLKCNVIPTRKIPKQNIFFRILRSIKVSYAILCNNEIKLNQKKYRYWNPYKYYKDYCEVMFLFRKTYEIPFVTNNKIYIGTFCFDLKSKNLCHENLDAISIWLSRNEGSKCL
jgi:hypothetical protein